MRVSSPEAEECSGSVDALVRPVDRRRGRIIRENVKQVENKAVRKVGAVTIKNGDRRTALEKTLDRRNVAAMRKREIARNAGKEALQKPNIDALRSGGAGKRQTPEERRKKVAPDVVGER
jgi:hypothetical protein